MKDIQKIKSLFNNHRIRFISEVYLIQNKKIPDFKQLNEDEILQLYSKTMNEINDKLLRSRQIPLDKVMLMELGKLSCPPKSTATILRSMF
jgi:hypothetical protein